MKLSDELITRAKRELLVGSALAADLYQRAATQISQDEALIAHLKGTGVEPGYGEGRKWWRQGYEAGRAERDGTNTDDLIAAVARLRALIPANPELIEAGYAVPTEDILAALKGAS